MGGESGRNRPAGGFTLVELLVVILIVGLASAVALPTVYSALVARQVSEAGRILQGALVGARDKAIHDDQPAGIRLIPDPTIGVTRLADGSIDPAAILCYSRWIPIEAPPQYTEGRAAIPTSAADALLHAVPYRGGGLFAIPGFQSGVGALLLEESATSASGAPNAPTSWAWNVRVGDAIRLGGSGPWYTVVGPTTITPAPVTWDDGKSYANPEMFVNYGPPGWDFSGGKGPARLHSPLIRGGRPVEFLFLVDGRDDDGNGWIDEGFDGVDNDGNGAVDEPSEWEREAWQGAAARGLSGGDYTIRRRPAPAANAREVAMPTSMVIDATTAFATAERSRLPVDPFTGAVDILINPDGTVAPSVIYSSPASVGMAGAFYHFWLADRRDLAIPSGTTALTLPAPAGGYLLMTLDARTGRMVAVADPPVADPYSAARRGVR